MIDSRYKCVSITLDKSASSSQTPSDLGFIKARDYLCYVFMCVGYLGKEVPDSSDLGFVKAKDGKRFRLLEEIADHWKRIAKTLKLETPKITSIQRSSEDDDDRIAAVFQVWFENATAMANSDSYPLSWYGLNEILKDSELAGIADRFFKFLEKC